MTNVLFTPQGPTKSAGDLTDPSVASTPGPAVLLATPANTPVEDTSAAGPNRPLAYREAGAAWHELGYEATDHWENLSPTLRERLIADRTAQVSHTEYSTTTNGASASMITNNWVHSGSPRTYRIAGELRELAEVVSQLS